MTNEQAKAICRHLLIAHQALLSCAPAAALRLRLSNLRDSLNPDSFQYRGDVEVAYRECQEIDDGLRKLTGVQPVTAVDGETISRRNPPTLLPGVADALEQVRKAGELLVNLLKVTPGKAST